MRKEQEIVFVCGNCGNEFNKWMGQCGSCGEWNSLKEVKGERSSRSGLALAVTKRGSSRLTDKIEIVNLGKMDSGRGNEITFLTDIAEFDRVLGKGIVRGGVYLLAGEPGIGKSTLVTQILGKVRGLYVAAEESAEQIGMRVERLKLNKDNFEVLETNSSVVVWDFLSGTKNLYDLVVMDSVQMFYSDSGVGSPGSVGQIKQVAMEMIEMAKKKKIAIVILGHVTKEGEIAGPKLLEHMVDTVLYFEGDKNSDLRILRCAKNRFGSVDEVGVFKMESRGLVGVKSGDINLVEEGEVKVGSAVTIVMEGTRPMVTEVQALVTESFGTMPKRVFSGVDFNRGQLLVAVTQKILGVPLYKYDVYVSVTGGIRIDDTGADLAIVGAIWSSYKEKPLGDTILVGEVSLLGGVKKVKSWDRRLKEAESVGRKVMILNNVKELRGS